MNIKRILVGFLFLIILVLWYLRSLWVSSTNIPDWVDTLGVVLMMLPLLAILVFVIWTMTSFKWERLATTLLLIVATLSSMLIAKFAFINWLMIVLSSLLVVKVCFYKKKNPKSMLILSGVLCIAFFLSLLNPIVSARWSYAAYVDPITALNAKIYLTKAQKEALSRTGVSHIETRNPKIRIDSSDYRNFGIEKYGYIYIADF